MNAKGVDAMGEKVVHKEDTYWGYTTIECMAAGTWRKEKGLATFQLRHVTCPDCLKAIIEQCEAKLKELETQE